MATDGRQIRRLIGVATDVNLGIQRMNV